MARSNPANASAVPRGPCSMSLVSPCKCWARMNARSGTPFVFHFHLVTLRVLR